LQQRKINGEQNNFAIEQFNGSTYIQRITIDTTGNVGIGTYLPAFKLDIAGTFNANSIRVNNAFTFPTADGTSGQVLTTNGSGSLIWASVSSSGSGGVTSINGDTTYTQSIAGNGPISVATTSGTTNISITKGDASNDGYISKNDWITFNSKLSASLAQGKILVGNASGVATAVDLSGDATIDNTGALTLANSGVTAGTYGTATSFPVVTVDAKGRVTSVTTNSIAAAADSTTVSNGLTEVGTDIQLGGTLTSATTITQAATNITFVQTTAMDTFEIEGASDQELFVVTDDKIGIGTEALTEKLTVDGGIQIGAASASPNAGALQWTGSDFQGYNGTAWVSLTVDTIVTCPAGYAKVNATTCIETAERTASTWYTAVATCAQNNAKLPTWSEWYSGVT